MRHHHPLRATAVAAALLAVAIGATAQTKADESSSVPPMAQSQLDMATMAAKKALDSLGIELWGYMRAGAYYSKDNLARGHFGLGDLGYNRLGNEGDQYFEFGIGKKWVLDGAKVGTYWMPYAYRNASHPEWEGTGTKQIYADITGMSFAPDASFWAGQRYHRIQDVHIIDNWLMEDGDNFGAGVDGIKLGSMGSLNVAVYTEGNTDSSHMSNNGKRLNFQWRNLAVAPGGTLDLTAGIVRGDFTDKKTSLAFGGLYNQKIGVLTNSLFVQGANGHSDLRGKFDGLDSTTSTTIFINNPATNVVTPTTTTTTTPGVGSKKFRVVDAINWQSGAFGGQAVIGYETNKRDADPTTSKNFALGGRLSYGVAKNIKVYGDANYASLKPADGSATQNMNKLTAAVAVAPNTDFWTRPEVRLYLTRIGGNDAYKATGAFGTHSSALLAGVQVESWW